MNKEKLNKIISIMQKIEYGFKDEEGNNIINNQKKWDEEFSNFYYLLTPEELLLKKCGVCWDQVELERYLFKQENIECQTFFIYIEDKDMLPSHTFLTYEDNNKFYWFENSWQTYRGIHEYSSLRKLLKDVTNKFINSHPEVSKNAINYLYEYQKPTKNIKCDDFYKYIKTQKKIDL